LITILNGYLWHNGRVEEIATCDFGWLAADKKQLQDILKEH